MTVLSDVDVIVVLPSEPSFEKAVQPRTTIPSRRKWRSRASLYMSFEMHVIGERSWQNTLSIGD